MLKYDKNAGYMAPFPYHTIQMCYAKKHKSMGKTADFLHHPTHRQVKVQLAS